MIISSSALLTALAIIASRAIPSVTAAEVATDEVYSAANLTAALAPPGFNAEGTSVFTNYVNAYNNKQLFYVRASTNVYEKPESDPAQLTSLHWCSDLTFSDL